MLLFKLLIIAIFEIRRMSANNIKHVLSKQSCRMTCADLLLLSLTKVWKITSGL